MTKELRSYNCSVLANSILANYVIHDEKNFDSECNSSADVKAFVSESVQALSLYPLDADVVEKRFELIRPFIIKILLYLDLGLDVNELAPLARITETLALHPEIDLNSLVDELSELWQTSPNAIFKLIRKAFNVYDPSFTDKISSLTCSQPFTARDVVSDLAVYVRKMHLSGLQYARING